MVARQAARQGVIVVVSGRSVRRAKLRTGLDALRDAERALGLVHDGAWSVGPDE